MALAAGTGVRWLGILAVVVLGAGRAQAQQCGAAVSECASCHDRTHPIAAAPWHRDHAFADLCADCHGGHAAALDASAAHADLAPPATRCASCHGPAAAGLLDRYDFGAGEAPTLVAPAPPAGPAPLSAVLALVVALVGVTGVLIVARVERWRLGSRTSWSPYLAGAGLGLLATVSLAVFGKRLSSAGGYQQLAGHLGAILAPDNVYFRHLPAGVTWELLVCAGMFIGAFVSALSGGQFRLRLMPDSQWRDVFGPSVARRWLIVFAGTAVIQIAAGIAGGCTASLAVSGGAVVAPGAFVFMAGMFAGGIPVARLLYRRRP